MGSLEGDKSFVPPLGLFPGGGGVGREARGSKRHTFRPPLGEGKPMEIIVTALGRRHEGSESRRHCHRGEQQAGQGSRSSPLDVAWGKGRWHDPSQAKRFPPAKAAGRVVLELSTCI